MDASQKEAMAAALQEMATNQQEMMATIAAVKGLKYRHALTILLSASSSMKGANYVLGQVLDAIKGRVDFHGEPQADLDRIHEESFEGLAAATVELICDEPFGSPKTQEIAESLLKDVDVILRRIRVAEDAVEKIVFPQGRKE